MVNCCVVIELTSLLCLSLLSNDITTIIVLNVRVDGMTLIMAWQKRLGESCDLNFTLIVITCD